MRRACRHAWIPIALLFFTAGMPGAAVAQETVDGPGMIVIRLHAALLAAMKNAHTLGYKGRYANLAPVVRESYDLSRVVRVAAGSYWRGLNHEQKVLFFHTFSRLVIATYAHRFDGYSGERFKNISERPLGRGNVVVRTVLVKHNGGLVHLDYVLHRRKGMWRIINVIAEGVSDLALKRVEYTTVLRNQGFEALMAKLKAKVAQYE